ncbi:MAG: GAF domain-containing protein [Mangrovibacterium sp.]
MNIQFENHIRSIESMIIENKKSLLLDICQYLKNNIFHYDWVGFYILRNGELVLGDFAGKPTQHTNIAIGKGVCGQVAASKTTMIVQDVTQIDNYISCGLDVQSEIVVPILNNGKFIAELDIDSHSPSPFLEDDKIFLEKVCKLIPIELLLRTSKN